MELAYYTLQFHVHCEGGARHSGLQRRIDQRRIDRSRGEIIPTELRHQLSKSNLKRQIGDIYEYTSLAYRASKTRKVPPLPPPRCRYGFPPGVRMAPGFPPNTTWYRSA